MKRLGRFKIAQRRTELTAAMKRCERGLFCEYAALPVTSFEEQTPSLCLQCVFQNLHDVHQFA
ncbi:hypothetical protein [uncultured Martelella sp.]|uniref:hypothetical protein n=1 Tax=uncultured Martelella sp. TaxID=392331 RepID=UPI0029C65E77|nr:hypothetical protein [uncultured Martelella sp.]